MKVKYLKRKVLSLIAIGAISLSLASCGKPKPVTPSKNAKESVEDTAMTKKITKEKIVSGSKVYVKDKMIIATMIIEKGAKKETITKVANAYAKELKTEYNNLQGQYKGFKINVQAVQKGKNMANILIEK